MKKRFLFVVCAALLVMFNCSAVYAFRPLTTEDASIPGKGGIDIEPSFTYTRENNANNNFNFLYNFFVEYRCGKSNLQRKKIKSF